MGSARSASGPNCMGPPERKRRVPHDRSLNFAGKKGWSGCARAAVGTEMEGGIIIISRFGDSTCGKGGEKWSTLGSAEREPQNRFDSRGSMSVITPARPFS
jgi:hypothetical protein